MVLGIPQTPLKIIYVSEKWICFNIFCYCLLHCLLYCLLPIALPIALPPPGAALCFPTQAK